MKSAVQNIIIGALLFATAFFAVKSCRNQLPDDSMIIKKSVLDSINAIAASIPDTVRKDTIIYKDRWKTRWLKSDIPVPDTTEKKEIAWNDSVKTDEVAIYINDIWGNGVLRSRDVGYKLFVPQYIKTTETITKKVPVIVEKETEQKNHFFLGGIGYRKGFIIPIELGTMTKNYIYSGGVFYYNGNIGGVIRAGVRF